ncbi:MAG: hypothetical protein OEO23_03530 [Gemmatimonadota bacterium]|nr:hypothetical protein [Gemmatimonadota bacterium]
MKTALIAALMLSIPFAVACQAPDFAGTYSMAADDGGQVVITLHPSGGNAYAGTMANGGLEWQLAGDVYEDALTGTVDTGQGTLAFEAYVFHDELEFILVQLGPDGQPDVDNGQEFIFTRTAAAASAGPSAPRLPGSSSPPQADPFVGTFSDGQMTLQLQGGDGHYSGQISVGPESFPVSAQRKDGRIEGVMNAANGQYGFYLTATESGVDLDNAGEVIALARVGGEPGRLGEAPPDPQSASPRDVGGEPDTSPLATQWRQVLAGKKVTYTSSYNSSSLGGGGFSTRNVYHICSDGRFAFSDNSSVTLNSPQAPDLGTPGSADGGSGTWRIVTEGQLAGIELRFNSGEVAVYRLDMQNGQVYANGDRVYVTPGEVCY